MTKKQYVKYEAAVKHNTAGLTHVSTGACPGCDECGLSKDASDRDRELAEEPGFSWSSCDCCGSSLGGDRHPAHGVDKDGGIVHFQVCQDCVYYLNYGQLDDMSMMEMEGQKQ